MLRIMSTILYMMIGFVPDEHIREWAQGISWIVEAPTFSFIAGVASWRSVQVSLRIIEVITQRSVYMFPCLPNLSLSKPSL